MVMAMIVLVGGALAALANVAFYLKRVSAVTKMREAEFLDRVRHRYVCPSGHTFDMPDRVHDYTVDSPMTYVLCPVCHRTLIKVPMGADVEREVVPKKGDLRRILPKLKFKSRKKPLAMAVGESFIKEKELEKSVVEEKEDDYITVNGKKLRKKDLVED